MYGLLDRWPVQFRRRKTKAAVQGDDRRDRASLGRTGEQQERLVAGRADSQPSPPGGCDRRTHDRGLRRALGRRARLERLVFLFLVGELHRETTRAGATRHWPESYVRIVIPGRIFFAGAWGYPRGFLGGGHPPTEVAGPDRRRRTDVGGRAKGKGGLPQDNTTARPPRP